MLSHVVLFIYTFLLFFVLTPGILVTLPRKASKMVVAAVHAVIFAIVWTVTHKLVLHVVKREGMKNSKEKPIVAVGGPLSPSVAQALAQAPAPAHAHAPAPAHKSSNYNDKNNRK